MKVLTAVAALVLIGAFACPRLAPATPADSTAAPPDSLPRRPITVVRVPVGASPLAPVDSSAFADSTAPPRRKDGSLAPPERFFVVAGLGFPIAPPALTSQWDPGGSFGAGMDFLLEPRFSVRIRGDWAQLPFDSRQFLKRIGRYGTGATVEGGAASLVLVSILPRLHTRGGSPGWFIEAGPGVGMARNGDALLYDPVFGRAFENPGEHEFRGGMSAGAGFELVRRDGSGMFVDLHWSALFTRGRSTQFIPFTVGLIFP